MAQGLVTIFGGSGFLGRDIVRRLAKEGYRLRVATRHPTLSWFLRPMGDVGQIALLRCDIRNEAQVAEAVRGADIVVNLVGILSESGQSFADVQVAGAATVARAAKAAGASRLIHISAIGANTDSPSAYARTKAEGEAAVREAFPEATILRPSIVFGPGDGFFNRFAGLMRLAKVTFPLFGGGATKFQPVFVGDVADAVANVAKDATTKGRVFELGGPAVYSLKEILELISKVTERKRFFIPIPFAILDILAATTGWLPFAPITLDQARLLRADNVVKAGADKDQVGTIADLGVQPTAVEAVIPSYLYAYRRTGQYAEPRGA